MKVLTVFVVSFAGALIALDGNNARVLLTLWLFSSHLVPEDGFLAGCVFAIADYPEQMPDKQLLTTWKRVSTFPIYLEYSIFRRNI